MVTEGDNLPKLTEAEARGVLAKRKRQENAEAKRQSAIKDQTVSLLSRPDEELSADVSAKKQALENLLKLVQDREKGVIPENVFVENPQCADFVKAVERVARLATGESIYMGDNGSFSVDLKDKSRLVLRNAEEIAQREIMVSFPESKPRVSSTDPSIPGPNIRYTYYVGNHLLDCRKSDTGTTR